MRWVGPAVISVSLGFVGAAQAEAPGQNHAARVKPLVSADRNVAGQAIIFPKKDGHITAAIYEIAPGAALPVHKHPSQRLGYVLAGTLRVTDVEHGTDVTYKTGDIVLEAVDVWHKGENIGSDELRLLVIDLTEKGAATTVMK